MVQLTIIHLATSLFVVPLGALITPNVTIRVNPIFQALPHPAWNHRTVSTHRHFTGTVGANECYLVIDLSRIGRLLPVSVLCFSTVTQRNIYLRLDRKSRQWWQRDASTVCVSVSIIYVCVSACVLVVVCDNLQWKCLRLVSICFDNCVTTSNRCAPSSLSRMLSPYWQFDDDDSVDVAHNASLWRRRNMNSEGFVWVKRDILYFIPLIQCAYARDD